VKLIRSYAAGRTDDEAFSAALGLDVAGFEAAWLADLGATAPARYGPQPAPAGPLPPGWGGAIASPGPDAAASSAPGAAASGPAASALTKIGAATTSDGSSSGLILLAIAAAGLCLGGLLAYIRRRRGPRPVGAPGPEPPGPGE
jgi:hypothetical protein